MDRAIKQCVIDTNVPIMANKSLNPDEVPNSLVPLVKACIDAIGHVINHGGLVIDAGDEIFDEYRRHLSLKGQPGIGDAFLKWVHDNRWGFPDSDRVHITQCENGYIEFPIIEALANFDPNDKKFVAVANAHNNKPPILQGTDSKWWGWKDALFSQGIRVLFLDESYIQAKYNELLL